MPPPSKASTRQVHANLNQPDDPHKQQRTGRDLAKFRDEPLFGRGPRAVAPALDVEAQVLSGPPPKPTQGPLAVATLPEWNIYWVLTQRMHLHDGIDFLYRKTSAQTQSLAQRSQLDFMLMDGSQIAIEVQGIYWHYQQGRNKIADDLIRQSLFATTWKIVNIDEDDAMRNPEFYVREALQGRDHSYRYKGTFYQPNGGGRIG